MTPEAAKTVSTGHYWMTVAILTHLILLVCYHLEVESRVSQRYIQATNTQQNWRLFSPNPPKVNRRLVWMVKDQSSNLTHGHHALNHAQVNLLNLKRMYRVHQAVLRSKKLQFEFARWLCGKHHKSVTAMGKSDSIHILLWEESTPIKEPHFDPLDQHESKRILLATHQCLPSH